MLVHHVEVQKIEDQWQAHYAAEAAAATPSLTKAATAVKAWFANLIPSFPMPATSPSWSVA